MIKTLDNILAVCLVILSLDFPSPSIGEGDFVNPFNLLAVRLSAFYRAINFSTSICGLVPRM